MVQNKYFLIININFIFISVTIINFIISIFSDLKNILIFFVHTEIGIPVHVTDDFESID